MQKRLVFMTVLMLFLLACSISVPSLVSPTQAVQATLPPPALVPMVMPPGREELQPAGAPFTVVRLSPLVGSTLSEQIQAEVPLAGALGQHIFVEFDASW